MKNRYFNKEDALSTRVVNYVFFVKKASSFVIPFKTIFFLCLIHSLAYAQTSECEIDLSTPTIELIARQGTAMGTIDNEGFGITIEGNGWNALELPRSIESDTFLEFEFMSTEQGEEHGIGFSNDLNPPNGSRYKLYGSQNVPLAFANQDFTYDGSGGFQRFSIPIGQYINGSFKYLVIINDNDASPASGNSSFRNIRWVDGAGNCLDNPSNTPATPQNPPSINFAFNFATEETNTPSGFIEDIGNPFGIQGEQVYGWLLESDNMPVNVTSEARNRTPDLDADPIRETLIHMNRIGTAPYVKWEVEIPNGTYQVVVQGGDVDNENSSGTRHHIKAEGVTILDFSPDRGFGTRTGVELITVSDGRMTLSGLEGVNTKINAVVIQSLDGLRFPAIVGAMPADGAIDVNPNTTISGNFLFLPNTNDAGLTSIDNTTINTNTVQLFEIRDGNATLVDITVNGTGGGDAVNISSGTLRPNTRYRYRINGVRDLAGAVFFPYSAEFITGMITDIDGTGDLANVAFENRGAVAEGSYATLTIGPDDRLYGLQISGTIDRWDINFDGSLDNKETLTGLTNSYGSERLAIGLAFSPVSTPNNLVAFVTHSTFIFNNGPEFDGNLSRLSGANLENEELLLTGLPRSIRDHLSNSIVFDPNDPNVLYFNQGSNSAGGAPDGAWGFREERLLTAATLKLDLDLLPNNLPLDVRTTNNQNVINNANLGSPTMSDGTYNPYFNNAPLTLFGTGLRNSYDLVWHSNGQLYVPTNGTAGGSNSPESVQGSRRADGSAYNGPDIPFVTQNSTQRDFLFRIDPNEPIGYYGHPNETRGEYVLNNGAASTNTYPADIGSDDNYRGFAFDFEFNKSPNGIIEYSSPGALQGALIVCRYSGGSDLIALVPDGPNGDIGTSRIGIPGFTGFDDPLDLIEDPSTGNIYVSDFGTNRIILLQAVNLGSDNTTTEVEVNFVVFSDNAVFGVDDDFSIELTATALNSTIDRIEMFIDGIFHRSENESPYIFNTAEAEDSFIANLLPGNYEFKAVAYDNEGNTGESILHITIEDNPLSNSTDPIVSFVTPEEADVFNDTDEISIEVSATDSNGTIDRVDLFIDNVLLRAENFFPYTWSTTNPRDSALADLDIGTHEFKAVAIDDEGNISESVISITIFDSNASSGVVTLNTNELIFEGIVNQEEQEQTLTMTNLNEATAVVNSLTIIGNDDRLFSFDGVSVPLILNPGQSISFQVAYDIGAIAGDFSANLAIGFDNGTIQSVGLFGLSKNGFAGNGEPPLQQVLNTVGYSVDVGGNTLSLPTSNEPIGDEVLIPIFEQSGTNDITVIPIARYSPIEASSFGFYNAGSPTEQTELLQLTNNRDNSQTLFPSISTGATSFTVEAPFGFYCSRNLNETFFSEDDFNVTTGVVHAIRIFPLKDREGNAIENAYLIALEEARNGDYNDYVYAVFNIRPVNENSLVIDESTILSQQENDEIGINKITVFPNPSAGSFLLDLGKDSLLKDVKVTIFNNTGQQVYVKNYNKNESKSVFLDLNHLSNGLYYARIDIGSNSYNKALLKTAN